MSPDLTTRIAGIKMKNPIILAAGVLGNTGASLRRVAEEGAGAVTTKSITLKPKKGHHNPTVVELDDGFVNAMGLPNPGAEAFVEELKAAKEGEAPVIASIAGESENDFVGVAKILKEAKPDIFELNISCPNVKTGAALACDSVGAGNVVKRVKKVSKIPLSVKLSPNTHNIVEVAKAVEKAGADAITAINTVGPVMVIDVETGKPILANYVGGLSGHAIKGIALRCVYQIFEAVKIPIIGTGGISSGLDAAEMLMAGASAVGMGTVVKDRGVGVFKEVCTELGSFMKRKGYKRLDDLVGISHKGGKE